jgi:glycosyltransferase involved in cell wall biosynthesis
MNKNNICHLTTVHSRFDGRIFQKECISASKAGFITSLIVADNLGDEFHSGVNIIDIGRSKMGRLGRIFFKSTQLFFKAKKLKAKIYHFHDPELLFVGLLLKIIGRKVIYDVHEDLPVQIMHKFWIPRLFRKPISSTFKVVELFVTKFFDAIIVPHPSMIENYNKSNKNVVIVANFVDTLAMSYIEDPHRFNYQHCNLMHAGALTEERGVINMVSVATILPENYTLLLAGNIPDPNTNEKLKKYFKTEKVKYSGLLNSKDVNDIYQLTSLGIILYNNVGQYSMFPYAVKLFEYMARGIPVIMPDFGGWPDFNKLYNVGICVDVNSPSVVSSAIQELWSDKELLNRLSVNGKSAIHLKFSWQKEEVKLIELYRKILNVK